MILIPCNRLYQNTRGYQEETWPPSDFSLDLVYYYNNKDIFAMFSSYYLLLLSPNRIKASFKTSGLFGFQVISLLTHSIESFKLNWIFQKGYRTFIWDDQEEIFRLVILAAMWRQNRYIGKSE